KFLPFLHNVEHDGRGDTSAIRDLEAFLTGFLSWPRDHLVGLTTGKPIPESLRVPLPEFGETLEPTLAFKSPDQNGSPTGWLLLVKNLPVCADFDARHANDERGWSASETQRFERLMRDSEVPIGLLCNGTHVRLIYKPIGESTGTLTFPVAA